MPSTNGIEYATLFTHIMQHIWGDFNDPSDSFFVRAAAQKLRGTAGLNHENALDVLHHIGADITEWVDVRASDADNEPDVALFTVKFIDNSSILIVARRGIGSAIEVL